jgi:integrase
VEVEALLAAPDVATWGGRRDRTLLLFAIQTGLRAAELIGLRCEDITFGPGTHVRCRGKGRKERCTPLRPDTVAALRTWMQERQGQPADPLFPNAHGAPLSHDGLAYLLAKHLVTARKTCPSLENKRVTPHTLRHYSEFRTMPSAPGAMHMLQSGVHFNDIALYLGHESPATTHQYVEANLAMKELALARLQEPPTIVPRYRPSDELRQFLEDL